MKEKKIATEIIAVSIGNKACQESLRTAMAMGADRGIHIETSMRTDQEVQPLAVAKTFKFIAEVRQVLLINRIGCFKYSDIYVSIKRFAARKS